MFALWENNDIKYLCSSRDMIWKYNSPSISRITEIPEFEAQILLDVGCAVDDKISTIIAYVQKGILNKVTGIPVEISVDNYNLFLGDTIEQRYYSDVRSKSSPSLAKLFNLWHTKYSLYLEYVTLNEKQPPRRVLYKGVKLHDWRTYQLKKYKLGKLSQLEIDMLEDIPGWVWTNKRTNPNAVDIDVEITKKTINKILHKEYNTASITRKDLERFLEKHGRCVKRRYNKKTLLQMCTTINLEN